MQHFIPALRKSIAFLRTPESTLLVLIAALAAQLPHSAEVFHRVSTSGGYAALNWLHAYAFAFAVEFAVLIFVVRGQVVYSWMFAGFSIAINLVYYWQDAWLLDVSDAAPVALGALLSAVMLPLAIALYSHDVAHEEMHEEVEDDETTQIVQADTTVAETPATTRKRKRRNGKPTPQQRQAQLREAGISALAEAKALFPSMSDRTLQNDLAALRNGTEA